MVSRWVKNQKTAGSHKKYKNDRLTPAARRSYTKKHHKTILLEQNLIKTKNSVSIIETEIEEDETPFLFNINFAPQTTPESMVYF